MTINELNFSNIHGYLPREFSHMEAILQIGDPPKYNELNLTGI